MERRRQLEQLERLEQLWEELGRQQLQQRLRRRLRWWRLWRLRQLNQEVGELGLGIGWRPELAHWIDRHPTLGFVEILVEDFAAHGRLPAPLQRLRDRGLPII